jgi:hypothetical protein
VIKLIASTERELFHVLHASCNNKLKKIGEGKLPRLDRALLAGRASVVVWCRWGWWLRRNYCCYDKRWRPLVLALICWSWRRQSDVETNLPMGQWAGWVLVAHESLLLLKRTLLRLGLLNKSWGNIALLLLLWVNGEDENVAVMILNRASYHYYYFFAGIGSCSFWLEQESW